MYFGKEFASFHTSKIELLGQRAARLLGVKVGALKKKSAALAIPAKVCASALCQDSSPPRIESFSKFDSQNLCSPLTYILHVNGIERSKPLLKVCQKAGNILRLGFALSKEPAFDRVYFVAI